MRRALRSLLLGAGLLTAACGGAVAPTFRSQVLFAEDPPAGVTPYLGLPLQTGQHFDRQCIKGGRSLGLQILKCHRVILSS